MPPRKVLRKPVARVSVPLPDDDRYPPGFAPDSENDDDDDEEAPAAVRRPVQPQLAPNHIRPLGAADDRALWPLMDTPPRAVQSVPNELVNVDQATCQPCQALATNAEDWQCDLFKHGFRMMVKKSP